MAPICKWVESFSQRYPFNYYTASCYW